MILKRCVFILLLFALCCPTALAADDLFDMGKTPWGMSRKDTAKALGIKLPPSVGQDNGLSVTGFELGGFDGSMGYVFLEDKLVEVHFRIAGLADTVFSAASAQKLRDRLTRQFDRKYGKRVVEDAMCENKAECRYSLWYKDDTTAVGVFLVQGSLERNLGVSYMLRVNADAANQPHKGLVILPPGEDPNFSDFAFKPPTSR